MPSVILPPTGSRNKNGRRIFRDDLTLEEKKRIFFSKVNIEGPKDCWEWKEGHSKGYPTCAAWKACIVIWTMLHGEIPKFGSDNRKVVLRHLCNNKRCVNPNHLALGNQTDNARDYYQSLK